MQLLLVWGVYLALGVLGLALLWGLLAPLISRRVRLAILGLFAALALLAMALTAGMPQDYRPDDLAQYGRGSVAIVIQLLVVVVGGAAALAAMGRTRPRDAALFGVGFYLLGTGLTLYLILDGRPAIDAAALVFVGTALLVAAALGLAGVPRLASVPLGLVAALVTAAGVEALRGAGGRGNGPGAAPRETVSLLAIEALLFLFGTVVLVRAHRQLLARPLAWAAVCLGSTAVALVLRGPGEWAPGPGSSSTTLFGLPLALLAVVASFAILEVKDTRDAAPARPTARRSMFAAAPLGVVVLLLGGLSAFWHPASEPCSGVAYADSSPLAPGRASWALSPSPAAPRGAPTVADFDRLCSYHAPDLRQIVYVADTGCKWAQVDANYPLVEASGTVRNIDVSHGDSPWIHTSHDLNMDLAVDPASAWLRVNSGAGTLLHIEAEEGRLPLDYRPVVGDHVTVAGRWVFDCGHQPATEIHPAAVIATERTEWRADAAGGNQQVRVLRIWMNSAPGVVHVPLPPFDLHADFLPRTGMSAAVPVVQVVAGPEGAVRSTISGATGIRPSAAVHLVPPEGADSAYFEIILGYRGVATEWSQPDIYIVNFDRILVHDDLRQMARNTTGLPGDLINPQLGFAGSGRWNMQAIVDHTWRSLLANMPVESGGAYSLASVPPVYIAVPGEERLRMSVTGYAENDPSDGVQLASGSVTGVATLDWDAGALWDLSCVKEQSYTPAHGAWTLFYHVSCTAP